MTNHLAKSSLLLVSFLFYSSACANQQTLSSAAENAYAAEDLMKESEEILARQYRTEEMVVKEQMRAEKTMDDETVIKNSVSSMHDEIE